MDFTVKIDTVNYHNPKHFLYFYMSGAIFIKRKLKNCANKSYFT